jgi:rod shape-determining protein MreD
MSRAAEAQSAARAMLALHRRQEPRWRWPLVLGGGLVLSWAHVFAVPREAWGDFTPDLVTLFALFLGLYASRQGRYLPCLVLGLTRDLFSLGLIGSYAVLYGLLHKAASRGRDKLDPFQPGNVFIFAVAGVFFTNVGYHFLLVLTDQGIGWTRALARCAAMAAASGVLAVVAFPLAHLALGRLGWRRANGGFWNI